MKKCLVITCGFFGDIIFASSLAEKIKQQGVYTDVDYLIGFPQVETLLNNNPYIDKVILSDHPGPHPTSHKIDLEDYTEIYRLQPLNYNIPPCSEYQQLIGITDPTSDYKVYTQPEYDAIAKAEVEELRSKYGKPVIAVMSNWESKTYSFTPEQYKAGIDTPGFGYGGAHRNIQKIVKELSSNFTLLEVGVGDLNQLQTLQIQDHDTKSLLFEASLMKYCDAFLGTDGGLATIAAGVGTKTVITGDFNLQLYGWNGVIKKIKHPRLGPYEYFGDPHTVLDPYLTDEQVVINIINSIWTNK